MKNKRTKQNQERKKSHPHTVSPHAKPSCSSVRWLIGDGRVSRLHFGNIVRTQHTNRASLRLSTRPRALTRPADVGPHTHTRTRASKRSLQLSQWGKSNTKTPGYKNPLHSVQREKMWGHCSFIYTLHTKKDLLDFSQTPCSQVQSQCWQSRSHMPKFYSPQRVCTVILIKALGPFFLPISYLKLVCHCCCDWRGGGNVFPCRLYGCLLTCGHSAAFLFLVFWLTAEAAGPSRTRWGGGAGHHQWGSWSEWTGVEAGCRHSPHSCMLTHITRIQVTQFHILPVQTLSVNTQSENNHLNFFFFYKKKKKERLETTHRWGGGWLCSVLNGLRRILSFMLPVINMIITMQQHVFLKTQGPKTTKKSILLFTGNFES